MPSWNAGPVLSNLAFCLDALNLRSYPGTGSTWTDLIGNVSCTLGGNPVFCGGSLLFDGATQYASFPTPSALNAGNYSQTCEMLVYMSAANAGGANAYIFGLGSGGSGNTGCIGLANSNANWKYFFTASSPLSSLGGATGNPAYVTGWNHVVRVIDSVTNTCALYINGVLADSYTNGTAFSSTYAYAATTYLMAFNSSQFFTMGGLQLVRLYARALSSREIKQNYLSLRARMNNLVCTGGTETTTAPWKLHAFTTTGANTLTVTQGGFAEVLIVAGGGASGSHGSGPQGAGGGGGVRYFPCLFIPAGTHTLTVGAGGAIGATNTRGGNGGNSSAFGYIAYGGGGGGSGGAAGNQSGLGGGCGGGNGGRSTLATLAPGYIGDGNVLQGYAGGASLGGAGGTGAAGGGGGAGGAGGAGTNPSDFTGGNGGVGFTCSITGTAVTYGDGGGGGAQGPTNPAGGAAGGTGAGAGVFSTTNTTLTCNPGVANRGGGAGGGPYGSLGAVGGSGVIYIRRLN